MIMAGPDVPAGETVDEVVSLVDLYPTILEALGENAPKGEADRPGASLLQIASGITPERTVLSEYHAGGSITGSFMVRNGKWKYMHHVGYAPQLFDLESDPLELNDLGEDADHATVRSECEALLRTVVDPDAANAQAFTDQEAKIESHGGVEAVIKRGHFAEHAMDRRLGVE